MLHQHQLGVRPQHARDLGNRASVVGHRAQHQCADHRVERAVAKRELLCVALPQIDRPPQVLRPSPGDGQHAGAQVDPNQLRLGRIVGEVSAGADADLEHLTSGL